MFRVHLTSVVDTKATAITLQVGESSFSFVYSCPPPIRLLSLLYAGTVYPCIGLSLHAHACRVRFSNYSWGAYFRRTHETRQPHVIPFLFASSSQCSLFVTIILFTCSHFMFSFATSTSSSIKFLCFAVSNKCHNYLYLRSSLFFTIFLCCIFLLLLLSSFDEILTNCILACFSHIFTVPQPIRKTSRNFHGSQCPCALIVVHHSHLSSALSSRLRLPQIRNITASNLLGRWWRSPPCDWYMHRPRNLRHSRDTLETASYSVEEHVLQIHLRKADLIE